MTAPNHIFLPWVQPAVVANAPDQFTERRADDQPASLTVRVDVTVNTSPIGKSVLLHGPGDVTGIDPQQVVRLEPKPGTADFETNYFPFVEFDRPDFPWLFSPVKADAQQRLRPWLVLVVVRRQPGVELRPAGGTSLPVLDIRTPARPVDELPDLAESHFWAHAQTTGVGRAELAAEIAADSVRTVSRLMCARRLDPATSYLACVVPAFEVGRAAALGEPTDVSTLLPAWRSNGDAAPSVELPVYISWEFRTSDGGEFEELVRRLQPRELPADAGKRPTDISHPGFILDPQPDHGAPGTILGLEGALRPVDSEPDEWPGETRRPFQSALAAIVNTPWRLATVEMDGDPIVAPPIYGAWHAGVHEVIPDGDANAVAPWLNQLNLDPRHRVAAALGTEVVQAEQEALMAAAWEQLGAIEAINQRRRQAQLGRAVNERYHTKAFARFSPDALIRVVAPARSRFTVPDPQTNQPMLFVQQLARSVVPLATMTPAARKLSRPRGAINRSLTRAGGVSSGSFFTFFTASDISATFTIATAPASSGAIDVDDVSAAIQARIDFSRGFIWVEATPEIPGHWERLRRGLPEMLLSCRSSALRPVGMGPGTPAHVAPTFPDAARRHQQYLAQLFPVPDIFEFPIVLNAQIGTDVLTSLRPAVTVASAVRTAMEVGSPASTTGDELEPVMDAPTFPQPMYAGLRDRSPDHIFPGLGDVPPDSVQLLETNARFIEAYMIGLNSELGRELLWRGYPTDQRGTSFRQFWDATAAGTGDHTDISPVHEWDGHELGANTRTAGADRLVLLIRGEVVRRYPGVVIYAVKAAMHDGRRVLATDFPADVEPPLESHPIFRGTLEADVTFVGFDLTDDQVRADPGWFFVLQQQPSEPRFGLDSDPFGPGESGEVPALDTWNSLNWGHVAADPVALGALTHLPVTSTALTPSQPVKGVWGRNAAHMAHITKQLPVRVAIHASEFLP